MKQTKNLNLEYYDPSTDGHLNYDFDVEKRNLEKIDAHIGTPRYGKKENVIGAIIDNDDGNGIAWPEVEGLTLVNSIENGDFADGATGWAGVGGTLSASNNTLTVTGGGTVDLPYVRQNSIMSLSRVSKIFMYTAARVTNAAASTLILQARDSVTGTIENALQNSPSQNEWYVLSAIVDVSASQNNLDFRILHEYADAATATGKVLELRNVQAINMTALGIEHYTEAQMLKLVRQGYIKGLQGVQNPAVKSVGENIIGIEHMEQGSINSNNGIEVSDSRRIRSTPIQVKANTTYTVKPHSQAVGLTVIEYSGEKFVASKIGQVLSAGASAQFTTEATTNQIRVALRYEPITPITTADFEAIRLQIEERSYATVYKPYEATHFKAFTTLHRLPNGIKDRLYRDGDGQWRKDKRIREHVLQPTDITDYITSLANTDIVVAYTAKDSVVFNTGVERNTMVEGYSKEVSQGENRSATSIGCYYTDIDESIRLIVAKGKYPDLAAARADLAGTVIQYQLANPITEDVSVKGALEAIPGGKFYNTSDTFSGPLTLSYPTNSAGKVQRIGDEMVAKASVSDQATYDKMQSTLKSVMTNTLGRRIAWPEIEGLTLANSVKNGDFSNGFSDWIEMHVASSAISGGRYSFRVLAAGGGIYQSDSIKYQSGDKYFICVSVRANSNSVGLWFHNGSSYQTDNHTGSGKFEELKLVTTVQSGTTAYWFRIRDMRQSGWTEVEVRNAIAINMTALGIEDYTEEQMLNLVRQGYIEGLKGVQNPEIKSVGENLFNPIDPDIAWNKSLNTSTGGLVNYDGRIVSGWIRVKPGQSYSGFSSLQAAAFYDANRNYLGNSVKSWAERDAHPSGSYWMRFAHPIAELEELMLVEGVVEKPYQPYEATRFKAYTTLHSLPNGIKDKLYRDGDGKWRKEKRIHEYILKSGDIDLYGTSTTNVDYVQIGLNAFPSVISQAPDVVKNSILVDGFGKEIPMTGFDNASNTGLIFTNTTLALIVPKGRYTNLAAARADLAGTKILYQLAEPVQELVAVENDLYLYNTIHNKGDIFGGNLTLRYPTNSAAQKEEASKQGNQGSDWMELELLDWKKGGNPSGYMIDADGFVNLKGEVSGGTLGPVAFKVPYGPENAVSYVIRGFDAGTGVVISACYGTPDGKFYMQSGASGAKAYMALDGIRYKLKQ